MHSIVRVIEQFSDITFEEGLLEMTGVSGDFGRDCARYALMYSDCRSRLLFR